MNNIFAVDPNQMAAANGGLTAAHLTAGNGLAALVPSTIPMPAGADDVSLQASALFGAHATIFNTTTFTGLTNNGVAGSQSIMVASAEYQAADDAAGRTIAQSA